MTFYAVERTDNRGNKQTRAIFTTREKAEAMADKWNTDSEENSLPYIYTTEEMRSNE